MQNQPPLDLPYLKFIIQQHVNPEYHKWLDEYIMYILDLYYIWENAPGPVKQKYAFHFALLRAYSPKPNVIKAKVNSYYGFLAHKKYVPATRIVKQKLVAGSESIYTWIRMYRELESIKQIAMQNLKVKKALGIEK